MLGIVLLSISGGLLALEAVNYFYYKRTVNFVNQKTLDIYDNKMDKEWLKNYWIIKLSPDDIKEWIMKTLCYNNGSTCNNLNDYSAIPRSKMLKWIAYHVYFKSFKKLNEDEVLEAEKILECIEKKIEFKFLDYETLISNNILKEYLDNLNILKFGNSKIETSYKPMIIYTTLNTVKNISYLYLKQLGFIKLKMPKTGMVYFYYKNKEHNEKTTIFIHGLGFGITPYLSFIKSLTLTNDVIVPILPNISNMEFHSIFTSFDNQVFFPQYDDIRHDFFQVLNNHDLYNVTVIGHSFGTIILALLLKYDQFKKRINKTIFIDPVCFIDDYHKILNYIKNPDDKGSLLVSAFNNIIYKDVYVRYATQRFLYGPEYWIYDYNILTNNTHVLLSSDDKIVPSNTIHKKLMQHNIPCMYIETASHADVFSSNEFSDVISVLNNIVSLN